MLNEYYPECRTLPAINETFPQFSRPISLFSPLDLSLRAGNIIPITPPTTPSPPRKRQRLMSDENYLWRPHVMETLPLHPQIHHPPPPPLLPPPPPPTSATSTEEMATNQQRTATVPRANENFANNLTNLKYTFREEEEEEAEAEADFQGTTKNDKNNLHNESHNKFEEIPESQRSVHGERQQTTTIIMKQQSELLDTIYLDDDTIVLTEDENETLVSSQDLSGYAEDMDDEFVEAEGDDDDNNTIDVVEHPPSTIKRRALDKNGKEDEDNDDGGDGDRDGDGDSDGDDEGDGDGEDEDEYVDILSNDDDEFNPVRLQQKQIIEAELELERSGAVLTRNKLFYDNEELHNQAVNGLDRLFERDFRRTASASESASDLKTNSMEGENNKIYTNLDAKEGEMKSMENLNNKEIHNHHPTLENQYSTTALVRPHKAHKAERKRMKMRKYLGLDEETISPVSGTIIRKLRDDEELVIRKGDIDPAFNVVEITEEAKAILASIDNKIGAYLCQLCRTLYDDAFMLAQHRCPRIVHIEYKCSECEKVFNCPANLASHRRWHKPKSELLASKQNNKRQHTSPPTSKSDLVSHDKPITEDSAEGIFPCTQCGKTFRRHAYLKKHQASHQMLENLKSLDIFKHHNASTPPFGFPHLHQHHHHHNHAAMQHHHATHQNNNSHHHYPASSTIFGAGQRHYLSQYQPNTSISHHQHHHHNHQHHQQQQQQQQPQQHSNLHSHKATIGSHTQLHRLPSSAFAFPPFDQRRFYTLGELYLSQQLERSSAFQYVQQANHLRNLTTAVGNLLPSAPSTATTTTLPPRPLIHPTLMSLPVK